jgi:hypothetical protein
MLVFLNLFTWLLTAAGAVAGAARFRDGTILVS